MSIPTDLLLHSTKIRQFILKRSAEMQMEIHMLATRSGVSVADLTAWIEANDDNPNNYIRINHVQLKSVLNNLKADLKVQLVDYYEKS
jgi:hypothetical protein